jgi:hypothetical protein
MRAVLVRATTCAVVLTLTAACTDIPTRATAPAVDESSALARGGDRLNDWLARFVGSRGSAPILVGAGDIAECYQGSVPPPINEADPEGSGAERTAKLLDRIPGTVITVGDNAYQFGSTFDYEACYDPTWGRHFDRTQPTTGNHEYMSATEGYAAYFGLRGGPPGLYYYSYNVGSWHVIALNSTPQVYLCWAPKTSDVPPPFQPPIPPPEDPAAFGETCPGDAAQQLWLAADLALHAGTLCTVVYFHHPRFSSGHHGSHFQMQRIWRMLYQAGVDVVITAHDHNYERFAPQNAVGGFDPTFGIRQFVVGTGGGDTRDVGDPIANSEVILEHVHGVIALGLRNGGYGWAFVDVDRRLRDSGTGTCHGPPPA